MALAGLEPGLRLSIGAGVLTVVVLSTLGFGAVSRASDALAEAARASRDARERMLALSDLLSAVQDAETGERGYLLTGDRRFLEPFESARPRLAPLLSTLDGGNGTSARYRTLAPQLHRQTDELVAWLASSVASAGAPGTDDRQAAQSGKARMDALRTTVGAMRAEVERTLELSSATFQAGLARARRTALLALGAAVGLALALIAVLAWYAAARARAERAARTSSLLLRATIDNIMQGLLVLDRNLHVLLWNERFLELRGVPREAMRQGMPFDEIVRTGRPLSQTVDGDRTRIDGPLPELARREPFCLETAREDGLALETRGRPMADGHYVVTYSDVTALRRSERSATEQATRLESTLDHIVDGVITLNESGTIESYSAGAERLLGWHADEVLRRHASVLLFNPGTGEGAPPHARPDVREMLGQVRELDARRRDGTMLAVEITVGEMWLADRRLYIAVLRDVAERRRVEQLQNELLSTVSHEFRTPLTSIVGALGLLKGGVGGELSAQTRRLIEVAHDNGHRLVRLVNDFLDLEKMRSGQVEFRFAPHALGPLVRRSVDANRAYAAGYGVDLALSAPDEELVAYIDPERLEQVLANLISNAVKFSPRGGTVHVGLARDGGAAVLSVRDEGPGIPPEFRGRVFQKFAQADATDARGRNGTGLGLSIVKSIVERLDGQIGFDTTEGRGTTFRVGLPLWRTRAATVLHHGGGRHVLVVEDDPDVAIVIGELLRSAGYDARTVGTGADALAAVEAAPVDAVLLDLHLPDRNGRTLIAEFRRRFAARPVPILVLSATFGPHETADPGVLGADGCFEKPIDGPRLLETLRRQLAPVTA